MLFALGAAASVLDGLQSLACTPSSSSSSAGQSGTSFDPIAGMTDAASSTTTVTGGGAQISPQTMSALIAAQSQSGATSTTSLDPSQALEDLYSQIDANGDGSTTTTITYADGSKVTMTSAATSTGTNSNSASKSAASSYNLIEQMIQQQAQAIAAQAGSSLSLAA